MQDERRVVFRSTSVYLKALFWVHAVLCRTQRHSLIAGSTLYYADDTQFHDSCKLGDTHSLRALLTLRRRCQHLVHIASPVVERQQSWNYLVRIADKPGHFNGNCPSYLSDIVQTANASRPRLRLHHRHRPTTCDHDFAPSLASAPFPALVRLRGTDCLKTFVQNLTSQTFGSFLKLIILVLRSMFVNCILPI